MEGHRARKRFSQNFLHDAVAIDRILGAIDPRPGEAIFEIGPGLGAITAPLVAAAGSVTAIEIDRDLAARLRTRFVPEQLRLLEGDALALDWAAVLAPGGARIVGNLPYNVSTPLLFALLPVAGLVRDQHFMLQKEVVDRMASPPGGREYGRLSVMLQQRYRVDSLFDVPPECFSPAPAVTSSIVRMRPRPAGELSGVDGEAFARVVTAAFSQRRKTLRNALSSVLDEAAIRKAGIDPGARAETLDYQAFERLAALA